jgi:hypothetical protein
MYHFKICNQIKLVCFLKFIIHEINSKMVKTKMVVLTEREKDDANVTMSWMLQPTSEVLVSERER